MGATSLGSSQEPALHPVRLDALYEAISPVLTGFLRYLGVPEQDIDDLAQDVRLTIFQEALRASALSHPIHRWMRRDAGATQHLYRWVRTIATHAVFNYRTKSYRRREKLSPNGVMQAIGNDRSPARHAADAERIRVLLHLLDEIAEPLRQVLAMHYFDRSTTEAIARALGIPEGTVFSRLRLGREALKAVVQRTLRDGRHLLLTTEDLDTWLPDLPTRLHDAVADPADDGTSNRSWLALFAAMLRLGSRSAATGATPAASIWGARPMLLLGPIGLAGLLIAGTCNDPTGLARTVPLVWPLSMESDVAPEHVSIPQNRKPRNRSRPQEQDLISQGAHAPFDSPALPEAAVANDTSWAPFFIGDGLQAPSHERTSKMRPNALIPPMIAVCANASGCGEVTDDSVSGAESDAGASLCIPGEMKSCYSGPVITEGVGICRAGIAVCNHDGTTWGTCEGEIMPAPDSCATQTDEDCNGIALVCSGNLMWGKTFAGKRTEILHKVVMDPTNSMLVAATFDFEIQIEDAYMLTEDIGTHVVVAKFDPIGDLLWHKEYYGSSEIGVNMAADAAGNLLVAGHFTDNIAFPFAYSSAGLRDIFVAKLDSSGNPLWIRSFGDASEQQLSSIATDSAGNVLVTGSFGGTLDFGANALTSAGNDIFMAKFDPHGNHLWSARFGDVDPQVDALQEATGVAVDANGNIFLTGRFAGAANFGGSPLASAGGTDAFVAKFDPSGKPLWSKRFGDQQDQAARALAVDASGHVWVTGEFAGTLDFGGGTLAATGDTDVFVAKLDSSGAHLFSDRFGDSGRQAVGSIAIDAAGDVLLIGDFSGAIHFGSQTLTSIGPSDVFVAKLDASGHPVWSKQFPGNGIGRSIASDAAGNIAAAGNFLDTIDLGSGPTTSTGELDIFLVKLAP